MIRQYEAQVMCDKELKRYGLYDKGWRTNFTKVDKFIACCVHEPEKRIVLSLPHMNARADVELLESIRHEIAHAIVGHGQGHGPVWQAKAIELGAKPVPCAPSNLNGGRSLLESEIIEPKKIKAIQNSCPICFKVAVEKSTAVFNGKRWVKLECGHLVAHDKIKSIANEISGWSNISGSKTLYPYQVEGIKFIADAQGRALIADEPGLGKTIQALGALKFFPEMRPALWICKSSLKIQALKEAIEWCGAEMMGQIIEHNKMFIIPNLNLYIISMDLLRRMPIEKIEEIPYKTVIADEIQHFKNPDSSRTGELRKLVSKAEFFIPLSATPWKNRGSEYFPVLNMLRPELFPSPKHFKNNWVEITRDAKTGKFREGGIHNVPLFKQTTKSFIIRRMRDDVLPDLPKVQRNIRFVDMEDMYASAYDKEEKKVAAMIKAAMIDGKSMKDIGSMIMVLKHITGLAKVQVLIDDTIEWLDNCEDETAKMTLFHHHIDVGNNIQLGDGVYDGLDKWLIENGYNKSLRLLGGKSPEERDIITEAFKNNPKNRILIASTLASGEGLNLQFCQNVCQLERQWNPQNEEQAEFRFSRPLTFEDYPLYLQETLFDSNKIPKLTSIRVPYYIAVGTIDETLTNIVERKRLNFRKSMNDKDIELTWDENEIIKELAEYIVKKRYKG